MYFDGTTEQTFDYAIPISCDNNTQNVKAADPDDDEHCLLTPKPVLQATPTLFEPKQIQNALNLITSTTQNVEISSNAESIRILPEAVEKSYLS